MEQDKALEELEATMNTAGWAIFESDLANRLLVGAINALTAAKRPDGISAKFLRGRIDMAKEILISYRKKVKDYRAQQREAANPPTDPAAKGSPYVLEEEPDNPVKE